MKNPRSKPPKTGESKPLKNGLTVGSAVRSEGEGGEMQATLFSPASKSNLNEIRQKQQSKQKEKIRSAETITTEPYSIAFSVSTER